MPTRGIGILLKILLPRAFRPRLPEPRSFLPLSAFVSEWPTYDKDPHMICFSLCQELCLPFRKGQTQTHLSIAPKSIAIPSLITGSRFLLIYTVHSRCLGSKGMGTTSEVGSRRGLLWSSAETKSTTFASTAAFFPAFFGRDLSPVGDLPSFLRISNLHGSILLPSFGIRTTFLLLCHPVQTKWVEGKMLQQLWWH